MESRIIVCSGCGQSKPHVAKGLCSKCYYKQNEAWHKADSRRKVNRERDMRRRAVMALGGRCACCGEQEYSFLDIDHVQGGGPLHRKQSGNRTKYWKGIVDNPDPNLYRVLCGNCHHAITRYGKCPHHEALVVLSENGCIPQRIDSGDAGYDLFVSEDTLLKVGSFTDVPTGIRIKLPTGKFGRITGRSSTIRNLKVMVTEGIIDNGYTGPLFVGTWNLAGYDVLLRAGQRIAQLIIHNQEHAKWLVVEELPATERGSRGFGSTGK